MRAPVLSWCVVPHSRANYLLNLFWSRRNPPIQVPHFFQLYRASIFLKWKGGLEGKQRANFLICNNYWAHVERGSQTYDFNVCAHDAQLPTPDRYLRDHEYVILVKCGIVYRILSCCCTCRLIVRLSLLLVADILHDISHIATIIFNRSTVGFQWLDKIWHYLTSLEYPYTILIIITKMYQDRNRHIGELFYTIYQD